MPKLKEMTHIDEFYNLVNEHEIDDFYAIFRELFPKGKFFPNDLESYTATEKTEKAWDLLGHSTVLIIELEKRFYDAIEQNDDYTTLDIEDEDSD